MLWRLINSLLTWLKKNKTDSVVAAVINVLSITKKE